MNPPYAPRPARPVGVGVLTILQIFSGIYLVAVGAVLVILAVIGGVPIGNPVAILLFLLNFVAIALGIFSFIMAYGLWTGKGWAWTLSLIGAIIGIILGVPSLVAYFVERAGLVGILANIVPIALYVLILAYLNSGNVRALFVRTGGYHQQGAWEGVACPNCGSPNQTGGFCDRCGTRFR